MSEQRNWRWLTNGEWDAIAARSPSATWFHRRDWADAICRHDGRFEPRALGLAAAEGAVALMPLCVRRGLLRKGLLGRAASTQPGTFGGPILAERELRRADWIAVLASLAEAPLGRVDCFDNVLDPLPERTLSDAERAHIIVSERRATHVLELGSLPEDPRASYRKGCKHSITKARRADLVVERVDDAASIHAYYEVYLDSLRRWDKPLEKAYRRSLFEDLVQRADAELWVARTPEGRVAAGGLFLFTPRHCVWWHGSMHADLQELGPSNLLIHELVQVARERGCELFDFNPSGGHGGVESFKRSFRPEERALTVWTHYHPLLARIKQGRLRTHRPRLAAQVPAQLPGQVSGQGAT